MNITPRYFAATQYTILAAFSVVSWWVLLFPAERARGQLEYIFAPGYEHRNFFIWLAVTHIMTVLMAITFWLKRAATAPLAAILVGASGGLLGLAVWPFGATFIGAYSLGCAFAVWSWRTSNLSLHTDAQARQ